MGKPLKATDKRRSGNSGHVNKSAKGSEYSGSADPLADLFNDRRRPNGKGHKAK